MNIDVREYLRINPISVHELTLSGDGKDCFLYFPQNDTNGTGYIVHMQKTMFWSLCKSIFRNLVVGTEDNYQFDLSGTRVTGTAEEPIVSWKTIHLTDDQFTSWVRRHKCPGCSFKYVWDVFRTDFDNRINTLLNNVNKKLFQLRSGAKCDYRAHVELQTQAMKLAGWKIPDWTILDWSDGNEPDWDLAWTQWHDLKDASGKAT
jgi:hypothetical protein